VHAGIRWFMMAWYFAPVALASSLLTGCVISLLADLIARRKSASANAHRAAGNPGGGKFVLVAGIILVLFSPYYAWGNFTVRNAVWLELAEFVKSRTPPEARIGAFNSGAIGYFCDRQTVNLDAVVNNEAFRALTEGRFIEYVRDAKIDYIADEANFFSRFDIVSNGRLMPCLDTVSEKTIERNPQKADRTATLRICRVLPIDGCSRPIEPHAPSMRPQQDDGRR
jgi:hypothetical protein